MSNTYNDPLEVVPTVGMAGLYSLKAPYDQLLRDQVSYTCTAVISLLGALEAGQDPLNDVYIAHGDSQASYDADLAQNHCLITLQASTGDSVQVPNSALNGLPDGDGVAYMSAVLGVSLSVLPEDFDLTRLKQDISDLVFEQIGVRSTVYASTIGARLLLSHATHEAIESARVAHVVITPSNLALVRQLQLEKVALQAQLTALENYVKAHLPAPP